MSDKKLIISSNEYRPEVIPVPGKFYYVDYVDKDVPDGSYSGIAECLKVHTKGHDGKPIEPVMYEFAHPDLQQKKKGKNRMIRSLFFANEVIMEAKF